MPRVTLYTREGCHLCEEAAAKIERVAQEVPLALEVVDIAGDPVLEGRHGRRIPVVLINGREAFVTKVSEVWLRRALKEASPQ